MLLIHEHPLAVIDNQEMDAKVELGVGIFLRSKLSRMNGLSKSIPIQDFTVPSLIAYYVLRAFVP